MNSKTPKELRSFQSLVDIVAHLRGPEGCPWDKEQTHQSLIPFAIEEVYEFIDTIENSSTSQAQSVVNPHSMKEELGDMLFQVILHAQLAKESQQFDIYDIIEVLNQKMVRRHPHVFGNEKVDSSDEVLKNWEEIKKTEKKTQTTTPTAFDIPSQLPALQKAYKIGKKTEKTGFDWDSLHDVFAKVKEECIELEETLSQTQDRQEDELGDLLFAISQLARHLKFEPETALRKANLKFEKRYFTMLQIAQEKNLIFETLALSEKEILWQESKKKLNN